MKDERLVVKRTSCKEIPPIITVKRRPCTISGSLFPKVRIPKIRSPMAHSASIAQCSHKHLSPGFTLRLIKIRVPNRTAFPKYQYLCKSTFFFHVILLLSISFGSTNCIPPRFTRIVNSSAYSSSPSTLILKGTPSLFLSLPLTPYAN